MQKSQEMEPIVRIGSYPPYDFSCFRILCLFGELSRKNKTRTFIFAADHPPVTKTRGDRAPNVVPMEIFSGK